jgi:hypothetical protein
MWTTDKKGVQEIFEAVVGLSRCPLGAPAKGEHLGLCEQQLGDENASQRRRSLSVPVL